MIFLLITTSFIAGFASQFTNKKLQINMPTGNTAYGLYSLITALVAGFSYLAMTGFTPDISKNSIIMSFIYSVICIINVPVTFLSLKHNGIFLGSIFSTAGGNILPMTLSFIFLGEKQSFTTVISAVCILIASVLSMLHRNKKNRLSSMGLICALMVFLISGSASMIVKLYVDMDGSEAVLTLNFLTNVFMLLISVMLILFFAVKEHSFNELKEFKFRHYAMTFTIAFLGTIGGYVASFMYEIVGVIPYTIISSSVNSIITITTSLIFKEPFRKRYILCIILSILSMILPVL